MACVAMHNTAPGRGSSDHGRWDVDVAGGRRGLVSPCAPPSSAVTSRLVGRMSAMLRSTERHPSALSGATLIGRPRKALPPRTPQPG